MTIFKDYSKNLHWHVLNERGKAYHIMVGWMGSFIYDAIHEEMESREFCKKIVDKYEEAYCIKNNTRTPDCIGDHFQDWIADREDDGILCPDEIDDYKAALLLLAEEDKELNKLMKKYKTSKLWELKIEIRDRYLTLIEKRG